MTGAICGGTAAMERRIRECPTEGKRRRFVVTATSLWYSPTCYCLGCGDRWSDGERGSRPFARGWRQEAIAEAKRKWDAAPDYPNLTAFVMQELAAEQALMDAR